MDWGKTVATYQRMKTTDVMLTIWFTVMRALFVMGYCTYVLYCLIQLGESISQLLKHKEDVQGSKKIYQLYLPFGQAVAKIYILAQALNFTCPKTHFIHLGHLGQIEFSHFWQNIICRKIILSILKYSIKYRIWGK